MDNNKYNEINNRINKLYGNSTQDIKKSEMSQEEKQKVRKQMWMLLLLTVVTMMCSILIIFNPFNKNNNNNSVITNNNNNNELTIGEIDINNKIVQELNERVELSVLDLYYVDTFEYFKHDFIEVKNLPQDLQLHLVEKNNLFVSLLLNNGLLNYVYGCKEEGLELPLEQVETVIQKTLGKDTIMMSDFSKTLHYSNIPNASNLVFSKKGNKYIVNCNGKVLKNDLVKYPYQFLTEAFVIENGIELYYKVVFIDGEKVYKDSNFSMLITESKGLNNNNYVYDGSTYKYTFYKYDQKNYYLSTIENIK